MENLTNKVIQEKAKDIRDNYDFTVSPRGMEVREQIGGKYTVPMPAYIDLKDRKVNADFMFGEAAWIISGSNRLEDLTETMKSYANYSDNGITLEGAYGPKVIDQLNYVVDTLENDRDSRQAIIGIWRERPRPSKDIPCTLNMGFMIREDRLQMVVNMRSHDIVLGSTYDVFSFSAVGNVVRLLLKDRGINIPLDENGTFGDLTVNANSLHLYERHYNAIDNWVDSSDRDLKIGQRVINVMKAENYSEFISMLKAEARNE